MCPAEPLKAPSSHRTTATDRGDRELGRITGHTVYDDGDRYGAARGRDTLCGHLEINLVFHRKLRRAARIYRNYGLPVGHDLGAYTRRRNRGARGIVVRHVDRTGSVQKYNVSRMNGVRLRDERIRSVDVDCGRRAGAVAPRGNSRTRGRDLNRGLPGDAVIARGEQP